jgi:hypothetical protein
MFLVLAIYFGTIYYSVKKLIEIANNFDENAEPLINQNYEEPITQEQNFTLDVEIDKENVIYQAFMNEINKNQLDTTKKVLICCTGDYQSMALLAVAMNIFNKENIHVFTYNNHNNDILDFMKNLCETNKLTFHHNELNENDDSEEQIDDNITRYINIKDICKNNEIDIVFEAHTLINYSNMVLNNMFENKKEEVNKTYRPFLLIDNITLLRFFSSYNIPIDEKLSHLEYSRNENKILFNNMEEYISVLYPDWRLNTVENYNNQNRNNTVLNIDELRKDSNKGKYGFSIKHDFNKISFIMFKKLVDELSNEYKFDRIDTDNLDEYYMDDDNKTIFISDYYLEKIYIFERFLQSIDLEDLIQDLIDNNSEISDNSFEELDTYQEKSEESEESEESEKSENEENKDKSDEIKIESEESDDDKEYILRVDLNKSINMKIVEKMSDNLENEYLEGIIYVNIKNNEYYIHIFDENKL